MGFVEVDTDRGDLGIWRDDFQKKQRQKPAPQLSVQVQVPFINKGDCTCENKR